MKNSNDKRIGIGEFFFILTLCACAAILLYAGLRWTSRELRSDGLFSFDRNKPFEFYFARGQVLSGLSSISFKGAEPIYFIQPVEDLVFKGASLRSLPATSPDIGKLILENALLELDREYNNPRVYDGTLWELVIRQNGRVKFVSCSNNFPPELVTFARQLDELLRAAGSETLVWQSLTSTQVKNREARYYVSE